MTAPRSSTATLIVSMNILAQEIQSDDGVANAAIAEAAQRLLELRKMLRAAWPLVQAEYRAQRFLNSYSGRNLAIASLYAQMKAEVEAC